MISTAIKFIRQYHIRRILDFLPHDTIGDHIMTLKLWKNQKS